MTFGATMGDGDSGHETRSEGLSAPSSGPATFAFSDLLILDARIFLPTLMAPFRTAFALYDCRRHT